MESSRKVSVSDTSTEGTSALGALQRLGNVHSQLCKSSETLLSRADLNSKRGSKTDMPPTPSKKLVSTRRLLSEQSKQTEAAEKDGSRATSIREVSTEQEEPTTSPKKMLKLRSDGKLLSPKSTRPATKAKPKGRRGSITSAPGLKSRIAIIRYGVDKDSRNSIARKIQDILQGRRSLPLTNKDTIPNSPQKPKEPPKSMHPFFLGRSARATDTAPSAPYETRHGKTAIDKSKTDVLTISSPSKAGLLYRSSETTWADVAGSFQRAPRLPGTLETVWPPQGMIHVRPPTMSAGVETGLCSESEMSTHERKLKNALTLIAESEEVLKRHRNIIQDIHLKAGSVEATVLRKPLRKVMTGVELQRSVLKNISCSSLGSLVDADPSEDEVSSSKSQLKPGKVPVHGGLARLYQKIPDSLTAFDRFECDSMDWVHKYAPKQAKDVLQQGREVFILRDWLKSLTITAVETLGGSKRSRESSVVSRNPSGTVKKRRKRRAEALDGFVVSSDEEAEEMKEIPGPELNVSAADGQFSWKKSVIRAGDLTQKQGEYERLNNAVVISGPHGCGKTAAVYAVARELDFEIFEINSGSRRSGRDLIDKIGDMTRNHLVNRSQETKSKESAEEAEDALRMTESLKHDIESGRQSTMQSFFESKTGISKVRGRPKKRQPAQETKPKPTKPKIQKQSVILLEEVDVLFEEDKLFWATTLEIITRSRRPLIMTCTNESLLPLEELHLSAILRFVPPPEPLATDYLLLLACNEGHLLSRDSVSDLYRVKHNDLRSSIAELNLYCQMAIGDTQGGLGWFLIRSSQEQRPGKMQGALRVVSEGSYPAGIGWLSQDHRTYELDHTLEHETELLSELWHGLGLDFADSDDFIRQDAFFSASEPSQKHILADLQIIDDACDALSVADICSPLGLRRDNSILLDPGQPELPEKSRANYVEGATLLQADYLEDFTGTSTSLASTLRALAHRLLPASQPLTSTITSEIPSLLQALRTPPPVTSHTLQAAFTPLKPCIISAFAAPISTLVTDVAPYIRSIIAFDLRLEEQRRQLEAASSDPRDGTNKKRTRTTRASRAALEGGAKATTRRERWLPAQLDFGLVSRTGGLGWTECALRRVDHRPEDRCRRESTGSAGDNEDQGDSTGVNSDDACRADGHRTIY